MYKVIVNIGNKTLQKNYVKLKLINCFFFIKIYNIIRGTVIIRRKHHIIISRPLKRINF